MACWEFNIYNFNIFHFYTFILDILLEDKYNSYNSLNSILHKTFNPSSPISYTHKSNLVILVSVILNLFRISRNIR